MRKTKLLHLVVLSMLVVYTDIAWSVEQAKIADQVLDARGRAIGSGQLRGGEEILLSSISNADSIRLTGVANRRRVTFAEPVDAIIEAVDMDLVYSVSPALIPRLSHIKVYLNGVVAGVLPIEESELGKTVSKKLALRANTYSALNELDFEFVGHYTKECEDPFNTTLWMEISGESSLKMRLRPLALSNSLGMLPAPFLNRNDFNSAVHVPFLFAKEAGMEGVRAAGILASWFGVHAKWRQQNYPVITGALPDAHAVVLATNSDRPAFLSEVNKFPDVDGPTLFITSNPEHQGRKLLVLMGRDGKDLVVAAKALALGEKSIGGSRVVIRSLAEMAPRKAYDAPNWVHPDRPTRLGEMIDAPGDLQAAGYAPESIDVPVKMPPDLFTWRSKGVAMDLKYRYTPPIVESEARLRIGINDQLVKSLNLVPSGEINTNRLRVPFVDDLLFGEANSLFVPAFKLGAQNTLQFQFSTPVKKTGVCSEVIPENVRSMIDADSTIDFSGFDHFIELPDLRAFVTGGFPYSKYADLSHTGIVIPEGAGSAEVHLMLQILGRLGSITGFPATGVSILDAADDRKLAELDLLVIGALPAQSRLRAWRDTLPVKLDGDGIVDSSPESWTQHIFNRLNLESSVRTDVRATQTAVRNGEIAIMQGGRSPFASDNSIIDISASTQEAYRLVSSGMALNQADIHGSVTYFHPEKVQSALVGETYFVGDLPWWRRLWYWLSQYPLTLAIVMFLSILAISMLIVRKLRNQEKKRLSSKG